ncbi:MAG: insulinase family protein, partial [Armatimonadetes bacterium]|nr:insulinase family protein [Armatimonadota bacterium]
SPEAAPTVAVSAVINVSAAEEMRVYRGVRELLAAYFENLPVSAAQLNGIEISASVQPDYIGIHAKSCREKWRASVDVVLDLIFKVHFDNSTVRVCQAILRRLVEARGEMPSVAAAKAGVAALYPLAGRQQIPLIAWSVRPTAVLQEFCSRYLVPNRTSLAVSGAVPVDEVYKQVRRATAELLPGPGPVEIPSSTSASSGRTIRLSMYSDESAVWVGAVAPSPCQPDYRYAIVTMTLLSTGMGARLYKRLREELGIVYGISGQVMTGNLWPYMYVLCMCRRSKVSQVAAEIRQILEDIANNGPKPAELERARNQAKRQLLEIEMSNWRSAQYLSVMDCLLGEKVANSLCGQPRRLAEAMDTIRPEHIRQFVAKWWAKPVVVQVIGRVG